MLQLSVSNRGSSSLGRPSRDEEMGLLKRDLTRLFSIPRRPITEAAKPQPEWLRGNGLMAVFRMDIIPPNVALSWL